MRDYRYRAKGLSDLLNYAAFVQDGIILLKDGAFCCGWQYNGVDSYSTDQQTLLMLRRTMANTFGPLDNGWVLHADLIRTPIQCYSESSENFFPDTTSYFLDEERRKKFNNDQNYFESHYFFCLTYKPPHEVESKFKHYFVSDSNQNSVKGWEQILHFFERKIEELQNSLAKNLNLYRLSTHELLTHFHQCITGLNHPVSMPTFPVYLDRLTASQDFIGGFEPKIGTKHIRIIAIDGFPLQSHFDMLEKLTELPTSFRWSNRFVFLDSLAAIAQLKKYRRQWFQKRHGLMGLLREVFHSQAQGFESQDALDMAEDANFALQEAESGLLRYGYFTSNFILMEKDREQLEHATKLITKELEKSGFSTRIETLNAVEAYIGSLPGHGYQNLRKPMVSLLNLADFLPLTGIDIGNHFHPCPYYPPNSPALFYAQTKGKTPFPFNLHINDVGHTLVIGDTGSGKSTLLGFLMAQHLRYQDAQIFFFDKGYSNFTLCHALGGNHYDLASDSDTLSFAPFKNINLNQLDWACGWVETLCQVQGVAITTHQRKEIKNSLYNLLHQPSRTLTDLQASIQDKELKFALEFYTLTGAMGSLLDNDEDHLELSHVQVFEMQHLLEKNEKFVLPVLEYLFHRINNRLDIKKPSLIIIEEGHRFLKGKFAEQLEIWLRECRKQNCAVVFVTQGLSEILNSPYKHILLNSCPSKIFLPNVYANADYNKDLYHQVGLNDFQIQQIQDAIPKQDYYYTSANGNRLMNLALDRSFLTLLRPMNMAERIKIKSFISKYNDKWVYHFFKEQGLQQEAEQWLQYFQDRLCHE